jgi:hypothetical protein
MDKLKDLVADENGVKHGTYEQKIINIETDKEGNPVSAVLEFPHPETGIREERKFAFLNAYEDWPKDK